MNPDQLAIALFDFVLAGCPGASAKLKEKLTNAMRPPNHGHGAVAQAVELIYAYKDEAGAQALNLGVTLAEGAGRTALGGLDTSSRGARIATALRKMPGVEQAPAPPSNEPTPRNFEPPAPAALAPAPGRPA